MSTKPARTGTHGKSAPLVNRVLDFISSVRVGVVQLVILVILSMIGMLVMQQNVQGFEAYYASLTPAEKMVFGRLGIFDIYHSWYFNVLLLSLSLNIVLASIDRFPSAWDYIVKPKLTATRDWLLGRKDNTTIRLAAEADAVAKISTAFQKAGFKPKVTTAETTEYGTDSEGRKDFSNILTKQSTIIFGENGKWNRLGAYVIHVFLLTLFLGHFVALTTGFDANVRMTPGQITNEIQIEQFDLDKKLQYSAQLPFSMECTDIQQTLIRSDGGIDVSNTLDWRTQMKVNDPEYGTFIADVSMNKPLDYRGYRFFQAQTIPFGSARKITLDVTPEKGGETQKINIDRNGSANLPDGTAVEFAEFTPDFTFGKDGQPDTRSGEYNQPVAVLNITPPGGDRTRVFAFGSGIADNIPVGAPKAGYKWRLAEFEKSPLAHVLSIKYDPFSASFVAWYIGGFGLCGALMFVFFFSHKRVWAQIEKMEDGTTEVVLAGDANRNNFGFADTFKRITDAIQR
ncbi:MAG: cytochrome c biogenesis protein ResB [Pyrinomonadaceae bacterium]